MEATIQLTPGSAMRTSHQTEAKLAVSKATMASSQSGLSRTSWGVSAKRAKMLGASP